MGSPRFFGFVIGAAHPAGVAADWLATHVGPERRARRPDPERLADRGDRRPLARRPARDARRPRRSRSSPAARWRTSPASRRRATASWPTRATTSSASGSSARRGSACWPGRSATSPSTARCGCSASGRTAIEPVDVDAHGAMRADALEAALATGEPGTPTIVIAQVGNVNTGASDPMREVCAAAQGRRRLGPRRRRVRALGGGEPQPPRHDRRRRERRLVGHGRAQVAATCPTTAGSRSSATARRTAPRWRSRPPTSSRTRPARASRWTGRPSSPAGRAGWRSTRSCARSAARASASSSTASARARTASPTGSRAAGYEVLSHGLNQVLVALGSDDGDRRRARRRSRRTGTCWPSGTTWRGRRCIRISVCSHLTTFDDVDRSVDAMAAAAGR